MEKAVGATYSFLRRQENLLDFHMVIIEFIENLENIFPQDIIKGFKVLKEKLEQLKKDRYETQFLLYFDIISWLDAKIEGCTFVRNTQEENFKKVVMKWRFLVKWIPLFCMNPFIHCAIFDQI